MRTLPYCAAKPGTAEHAAWVALYIDSAEDEYRDADRERVGAPSLGMKVDPRSFGSVGTVGGGGGWLPWLIDDGAANLLVVDDPSPRLDIGIVRDAMFNASNQFRIFAENFEQVFLDLYGAVRQVTLTIEQVSPGLWEALSGEPVAGPPVPPPVASKRRQDAFKAERLRRSWRHQR